MEPLTPEELRVVACLVEKQLTTPDNYPLTENAVVAACNQLSNRNPVVAYDTNTVRVTLTALRQRGLARVVHTPGARVPKHRHILDEALGLNRAEVALVTVLALRGPQTVGELRTRTERMQEFASLSEVEEVLEALGARDEPLVVRLERQPGQKEVRYAQLLSGPPDAAPAASAVGVAPSTTAATGAASPPPGSPVTAADSHTGWAEEERPEQTATAPAATGYPPPAAPGTGFAAPATGGPAPSGTSAGGPAGPAPTPAGTTPGGPATAADPDVGWVEDARPEQAATAPPGPAARAGAAPSSSGAAVGASGSTGADRVAALEARLAAVEAELASLQAEHRELREELGLGVTPPSSAPDPGPA